MIKNKDPRIKQIRESFCRLKAQLLLNFMILKIPMGSALWLCSLFVLPRRTRTVSSAMWACAERAPAELCAEGASPAKGRRDRAASLYSGERCAIPSLRSLRVCQGAAGNRTQRASKAARAAIRARLISPAGAAVPDR